MPTKKAKRREIETEDCLLCGLPYEPDGESWDGLDPSCADKVSEYIDRFHRSDDEAGRDKVIEMLKFLDDNSVDLADPDSGFQLITLEEYNALRLNSWEREAIYAHLDEEALVDCVKTTLKNSPRRHTPATTYSEAMEVLALELCKRLGHPIKED